MQKQIQNIIDLVIEEEKTSGLSSDQIKEKYICGSCKSLAELIKFQFLNNKDVKLVIFERSYVFFDPTLFDMTFKHVCIATNLDKEGKLQPNSKIYDISGVRYFKDIEIYLTSLLKEYDNHFKNKKLYEKEPLEKKISIEYNISPNCLIEDKKTPTSIIRCYDKLNQSKDCNL